MGLKHHSLQNSKYVVAMHRKEIFKIQYVIEPKLQEFFKMKPFL